MTIKEVSEKYNINEATLRYYEKENIIFNVKRENGRRNYTESNLANIEFVICMRKSGMSIERLKKYISLLNIENSEEMRVQILNDQREDILLKIDELNSSLDKLNYKISNYKKMIINKK